MLQDIIVSVAVVQLSQTMDLQEENAHWGNIVQVETLSGDLVRMDLLPMELVLLLALFVPLAMNALIAQINHNLVQWVLSVLRESLMA